MIGAVAPNYHYMKHIITHAFAGSLLQTRVSDSHKGTYGAAYLVAGSKGMMGAALLAARACMRSGVGLLTVHVPDCGYGVLQTGLPEAKVDTDASVEVTSAIEIPEGISAIGIGPGLGQHPDTSTALSTLFLSRPVLPMVLDADALNLLALHPEWWDGVPAGTVLTPHPGEADRLLKSLSMTEGNGKLSCEQRQQAIGQLAQRRKVVIVLKGEHTCVCSPDGVMWINQEHGHPGMSVGGSGDVLTGIILSLLAQRYTPVNAACLGVYIHSLAADIALAQGQSFESWLPSDLIRVLGQAFNRMRE